MGSEWAGVRLPDGRTAGERMASGEDVLDVLGELEDFTFESQGMPKPPRTFGRRFGATMKGAVVDPAVRFGSALAGQDPYAEEFGYQGGQEGAGQMSAGRAAGTGQMLSDMANLALIPLSPVRASAAAILGGSAAGAALQPALGSGAAALEAGQNFEPAFPGQNEYEIALRNLLSTAGASALEAGGPMLIPGLRALGREAPLTAAQRGAMPAPRSPLEAMQRFGQGPVSEPIQAVRRGASSMLPTSRPRPMGRVVDNPGAEFNMPELDIPTFQRQGVQPNLKVERGMVPYQTRAFAAPEAQAAPAPGSMMVPPQAPLGLPEAPQRLGLGMWQPDFVMQDQLQPPTAAPMARPRASRIIDEIPAPQPQAPIPPKKKASAAPKAVEPELPPIAPEEATGERFDTSKRAETPLSIIPDARGRFVEIDGRPGFVEAQHLNKIKVRHSDGSTLEHDLKGGFNEKVNFLGKEPVTRLPQGYENEPVKVPADLAAQLEGVKSAPRRTAQADLKLKAGEPTTTAGPPERVAAEAEIQTAPTSETNLPPTTPEYQARVEAQRQAAMRPRASQITRETLKTSPIKDIEPGLRNMAQRQVNASETFISNAMEQFGVTKSQALMALEKYKKRGWAKLDSVNGRYDLKAGNLWEKASILEAARQSAETPGNPSPSAKPAVPKAPLPFFERQAAEAAPAAAAGRPKAAYKAEPQAYLDQLGSQKFKVSEIKVHPAMQYKRGAREGTGIVKPLKGDFSPFLAGDTVIWENNKGERFIANGHHRLDKAKASKAPELAGKLVKESEGVTFEDAKNIGAEMNFVEGKGTVHDNAKMIRDRKKQGRPISADHPGITGTGEEAYLIATHASDDLFAAFMASEGGAQAQGAIKPRVAAAIVKAAGPDQALQRGAMKEVAADPKISPEEIGDVVNVMRSKRDAGDVGQIDDLFGDAQTMVDVRNEARAKGQIARILNDQIVASEGAIKRPSGAEIMGVKFADKAKAETRLKWLKAMKERMTGSQWASDPEITRLVRDYAGNLSNDLLARIKGQEPSGGQPVVIGGDITGGVGILLQRLLERAKAQKFLDDTPAAKLGELADQAKARGEETLDAINEWKKLPLEKGNMDGTLKRIIKNLTAAPSHISPALANLMGKAQDTRMETDQVFVNKFKGIIDGLSREQLDQQLTPAFMDAQGFKKIKDPVLRDKAKQLGALIRDMDAYGGGRNQGKLFPTFFGWTAEQGGRKGVFMPEEGIFIRADDRQPRLEEMFMARLKMNTKGFFIKPAVAEARNLAEGIKDTGNRAYIDYWLDRVEGKIDPITAMIEQNFGVDAQSQAELSRRINVWTYRSLLGGAIDTAFKNLGQGVNTASKFGAFSTARAMSKLLSPQGRRVFEESGVMVDALSVFEQPTKALSQKRLWGRLDPILFWPMKASEYFNRGTAFHAALFEGAKRGLRGEALRDFAKWSTNKTQFRYDVTDTNPYFNSPVGKLFSQFHSYPTKQAYFLYDMARKGGDKGALIRHLLLTGMIVGLGDATDSDFTDMMSYGKIKIGDGSIPVPYAKLFPGIGALPFEGGAALGGAKKLLVEAPNKLLEGQTGAAKRSFMQGLAPFGARYPLKVAAELSSENPSARKLLGIQQR